VIAEVTAAGFKLVGKSEILRNPVEDDHSKIVFDPSITMKTDQFILRRHVQPSLERFEFRFISDGIEHPVDPQQRETRITQSLRRLKPPQRRVGFVPLRSDLRIFIGSRIAIELPIPLQFIERFGLLPEGAIGECQTCMPIVLVHRCRDQSQYCCACSGLPRAM